MQSIFNQIPEAFGTYIPNLIGALAILIIGWIIALVIGAIVRGLLRRARLDDRLVGWTRGEEAAEPIQVERWVAKGVYYLVMLFVLISFFQVLGLTLITGPLNELLNQVFQFAPRVIGAVILLLIAWVVASVLRLIILRALNIAKLDERLGKPADLGGEGRAPLTQALADAVYWLVFLLFLPAILDALALQGLLVPVQGMMNIILGFVPHILAASLILGIGWFLARIVQRIVTNLLAAAGADRLSEGIGLAPVLGAQRLSGLLGLIVYVFIIIPALIAALDVLALEAVTRPASQMLNLILTAIPAIFAVALLMTVAYVVGRAVATWVTNLLVGVGFNNLLSRLGLGKEPATEGRTPAVIVGYLVLVAIMLLAAMEAVRLLGFDLLAELVAQFMVSAGHVALGLVIFALGLYLANLAARTVQVGGTAQAGLLALAARISILVLAGAMALRQMGLANEIVNLAFGLLIGAVALAAALAFGLGGRETAASVLGEWARSIKSKKS